MRDLGVTRWGDIELGPEPQAASDAKAPTQHTPDEIERKRRDDQRLLALAASGRLVPRLARPDQQ
jgi:hypothetical protein